MITKLKLVFGDLKAAFTTKKFVFINIILGLTGTLFVTMISFGIGMSQNNFAFETFFKTVYSIHGYKNTDEASNIFESIFQNEELVKEIRFITISQSRDENDEIEYYEMKNKSNPADERIYKLTIQSKYYFHEKSYLIEKGKSPDYEEEIEGIPPIWLNSNRVRELFGNPNLSDIIELNGKEFVVSGFIRGSNGTQIIIPYSKFLDMYKETYITVFKKPEIRSEYFERNLNEFLVGTIDTFKLRTPADRKKSYLKKYGTEMIIKRIAPFVLNLLVLAGMLSYYIRKREKELFIYKRYGMKNRMLSLLLSTQIFISGIIAGIICGILFYLAKIFVINLDPYALEFDRYTIANLIYISLAFTLFCIILCLLSLRKLIFKKYRLKSGGETE